MRRLTLPVLLFLAAPACNGEVIIAGETSATSTGAGGAGGSGGEGGSVSSVTTYDGQGGAGGIGTSVSVGEGGAGGSPACIETHDKLAITLSTWQGKTFACNAGAGDYEFSAAVVDTPAPGLFLLDSCSPAADCTEQLSKLSVVAPDLYTDVPKGSYVRVHVSISPFMGGCAQRVQIKNLPSWDGAPNPVQSGKALWLFAVDGDSSTTFKDSAIVATTQALGCFPGDPPGCGEHDDYAWRFQSTEAPNDAGVVVPMGATVYWGATLEGQYQSLIARNLRSYSTGYCDGPVDFAYWIAHQYQLD